MIGFVATRKNANGEKRYAGLIRYYETFKKWLPKEDKK